MSAAGYYRNPASLAEYLKKSTFLPHLNNEVDHGTPQFEKRKKAMKSLNGAMFVQCDKDEIVFPRESEIFGELTKADADGHRDVRKMEETKLYKEDWLGLKYLNENGKLKQVHLPITHDDLREADIDDIIVPFLKT